MSDFSVSVSELERHESSISEVAGQVRGTVGAAQQQPSPLMYGMLMGPLLTPVMQLITTAAGQYLNGATHAMDTNREQLALTRRGYAEVEESNTDLTKSITTGLGSVI